MLAVVVAGFMELAAFQLLALEEQEVAAMLVLQVETIMVLRGPPI
jgi:hypothetical protein